MTRFLLFLTSALLIISCSSKNGGNSALADSIFLKDTVVLPPPPPPIYKDTALDNLARFIAGLNQLDSNSFSSLEKDKYWIDFKKSMDTNWGQMVKKRLGPMMSWRDSTLSPLINDSLVLFYPFSGPDFLHAEALFPDTKEYVLAALEPVTPIPPLDTVSEKQRDMFLDSLGNSLRDLFGKSYFITIHMMKDLRVINGVLPVFLFFIERTGHEMIDLHYIVLDSLGNDVEVKPSRLNQFQSRGVKITFRDQETQEIKLLYYFSISISNKGIQDRPEFVTFLNKRSPYNTFVKSASYLMHHKDFTEIKNILLNQSESIFQDDTGIPYKDFKRNASLETYFYGEYVKPVKDFKWLAIQQDLDSAFKASSKPLPFSLGYHWGTSKQHYMLIRRIKK